MLGRTPKLPGLAVADHVEGLGAHNRQAEEDVQVLGFTQEDITVEAGKLLDLALPGFSLGGDDRYGGTEALDLVESGINLSEELVQSRVPHYLSGARLGDGTDVGQTPGQRRS